VEKVSVEVFEEPGRPEGGHAVVRLRGIKSIPDDLTFRIKPVDSAHQSDVRGGWAHAELRPIAARITEHGAELVVGPEVVENPMFQPGTLTVIEIQKCGVRGEFLWPRISPLVRPKRRHLRLAKPAREQAMEDPAVMAFEEVGDASADAGAQLMIAARAETPAPMPVPKPALVNPQGVIGSSPNTAPIETARPPARDANVPASSTDISWNRQSDTESMHGWSQRARATHYGVPHLAAALCAGAVLAGLVSAVMPRHAAVSPSIPVATLPETTSALAEMLAAGARTPKGRDVSQAAPLELLEAADNHLHGPPQARDTQEATFLLRRYLATTLGDERTLWALTQLGSSYADTTSGAPPDFPRARQLWQIAGTLGDPVAMCFLGALHEHGLGTSKDKDTALRWYALAKQSGGCTDVDQAIARMKK
jgi:hypothetical protein